MSNKKSGLSIDQACSVMSPSSSRLIHRYEDIHFDFNTLYLFFFKFNILTSHSLQLTHIMFIGILTTQFYLHGCTSLKEKRGRISGIREKFGRTHNIAVCEAEYQDDHNRACFAFVCTATNQRIISASLEKIVTHCQTGLDAELVDHSIDWIE